MNNKRKRKKKDSPFIESPWSGRASSLPVITGEKGILAESIFASENILDAPYPISTSLVPLQDFVTNYKMDFNVPKSME
jgi:hypothetical protein